MILRMTRMRLIAMTALALGVLGPAGTAAAAFEWSYDPGTGIVTTNNDGVALSSISPAVGAGNGAFGAVQYTAGGAPMGAFIGFAPGTAGGPLGFGSFNGGEAFLFTFVP